MNKNVKVALMVIILNFKILILLNAKNVPKTLKFIKIFNKIQFKTMMDLLKFYKIFDWLFIKYYIVVKIYFLYNILLK